MSACLRYPDDEVILRYVTGDLPDPEQGEFEDHLFGCDTCLARVERYQTAQGVLSDRPLSAGPALVPTAGTATTTPSRGIPWWTLGALAASLVLLAVWASSRTPRPGGAPPAVSQVAVADAPAPETASHVRNDTDLNLAVLAMVTPPPYLPITTRAAGSAASLAEAMAPYTRAEWSAASRQLAAVRSPEARFYQGIADLMRGDAASAATSLEAARASGVQPYARESRFYLGKAALQRGDLAQARVELTAARDARASTAKDAAHLLAALDDLTR